MGQAIYYYKRAVELGNSDALFNLGVIFENGGDTSKAIEYYKIAVNQNDSGAALIFRLYI